MKQIPFAALGLLAIVLLSGLAWILLAAAPAASRQAPAERIGQRDAQNEPTRQAAAPTVHSVATTPTPVPTRWLIPTVPPTPAAQTNELAFDELYSGGGPRGLVLSDKLVGLKGKTIHMTGFMAPPLKPALDFFVLTRVPLAMCPFCSSDTSWPEDIVFVRMPLNQSIKPTSATVRVTGRLEVGTATDPATGFVSLIRISADRVELLR